MASVTRVSTACLIVGTFKSNAILEISNAGLKDNWGYVSVSPEESQAMSRKLKMGVDPEAVWFVEPHGPVLSARTPHQPPL